MLNRENLLHSVGQAIGSSDWFDVTQARIDAFADVTEDWQPIHLDLDAGREAGFDGTVAHGFLTLSMLSAMSYQVLPPVAGGARIRAHFTLSEATPRGTGWMLRFAVSVEIEGSAKPALTADWLCLYLF